MSNGLLPAYPVSGETVETAWGVDLIDTIGERVYFVPNPVAAWSLDSSAENGTAKHHELTHLPANDPDIVAAECSLLIRDSNVSGALRHYEATPATSTPGAVFRYNTGTTARGGSSGSGFVRVGGVNNRQIVYSASDGADFWIRCHGWWKRAPKAVYPVEGDPIVAGWAERVGAQLQGAWEFVPHFERILNDVTPTSTAQVAAPILTLPDDPDIVAVSAMAMVRDDSGGDNINMLLYEGSGGRQAASIYSSGVASRGGMAGPYIVLLNDGRRDIWWNASVGSGCSCWLYVLGYWKVVKAPAAPAPGTVISTAWARDMIDTTARAMGRPAIGAIDLGAVFAGLDGQTVIQEFEITTLPADMPTPKWVLISPMIRDTNGTESINIDLLHPDDTVAGIAYTEGVSNRGGGSGPYMVKLGGPNGKSFRWRTSQAGAGVDVWAYIHGFAY